MKLITRTADGEALFIEQVANAPHQQHLMVLVVAAVAAPLHRPQLGELLLPVPQDMGFHSTQIPHLTNGEVALCGNERESFPH